MKNTVITIIVSVALSLGLGLFFRPTLPTLNLGAALRDLTTISNPFSFQQGVTVGGGVFATTSSGTVTISNTDLKENQVIAYTPAITGGTFTLPTRANLDSVKLVPNKGDSIEKYFVMATTNTAALVNFAGNTGTVVQYATTTANNAGMKQLYGGKYARLTLTRSATTTDIVYALIEIFN